MDIKISKSKEVGMFNITPEELRNPLIHLYVASNHWETLRVDLDGSIPTGILTEMRKVCDNIEILSVSSGCYPLLSELFPEHLGKLRKLKMLGKTEEEAYESIKVL